MIEFLAANWLWMALIVFFVAMHRGGHGCGMHGGHGGHAGHTDESSETGHQHTDQSRLAQRVNADQAHHTECGRSTS